jgi:hypothetical protein
MTGRALHSIRDIVAMLAARIEELAAELLPAGRRDGAEWRCGSVAGEPGQSLGVHLRGDKAGVWQDFASADPRHRGDALDLVAMCRFGGDKTEALRWARHWLGLHRADPRSFRQVQADRPEERERQERDAEGKRQKAIALFLAGQVLADGDPVASYLAGRGLPLRAIGRIPRALRFHPRVWCQEAEMQLPAMLAAMTRRGDHVATHRTYLMQDRGQWVKARLAKPKKVLGRVEGGFIPLWRGASGRPVAEAKTGEVTAIAEGIEDALTIALHSPEWRALAAYSLSNMANLQLPEACDDIVLIFDRDGENPQARGARVRAERALLEQGRAVRAVTPPEGFKDFNAWHQAQASTGRDVA